MGMYMDICVWKLIACLRNKYMTKIDNMHKEKGRLDADIWKSLIACHMLSRTLIYLDMVYIYRER